MDGTVSTSSHWKKIGAEFLAIFAGVVLGLLANSWRQAHEDRVQESFALQEMVADLQADSAELAAIDRRARQWDSAGLWVARHRGVAVPGDSAVKAVAPLFHTFVYRPQRAAYVGLRDAAELGLVRDRALRRQVVDYFETQQAYVESLYQGVGKIILRSGSGDTTLLQTHRANGRPVPAGPHELRAAAALGGGIERSGVHRSAGLAGGGRSHGGTQVPAGEEGERGTPQGDQGGHPVNDPTSTTSRVGRFLSALGVIASLVFVGLQVRQNTQALRTQIRQGLADRDAQVIYSIAENPALARAWTLMWQRDTLAARSLTMADSTQARWAMWGMLRMVENAYVQVNEGVLPESSLVGYGFTDNPNFQTPQFASFWHGIRGRFDPRFVAAFEAEYDLK